jgi:alkylation response protein AidB-like acyl-CoA dehydrogenase
VLARTPDAPPGTKGISLFVVPKVLVNDDGDLGERNDVRCVSLEEKLGIHASRQQCSVSAMTAARSAICWVRKTRACAACSR